MLIALDKDRNRIFADKSKRGKLITVRCVGMN